jgi:sortase A
VLGALGLGGGVLLTSIGAALVLSSLFPMWSRGGDPSTLSAPPAVAAPNPVGPSVVDPAQLVPADGPVNGVAFQMQVPAIGYSAQVVEGVTQANLENGPGHYPTTAWPGERGTVGIAAHNVYWLAFAQLRPGDQVIVRTRHVVVTYVITSTEVTNPTDVSVLASTPSHRLALTTCYPLWAGAFATQRYILFGRQIAIA